MLDHTTSHKPHLNHCQPQTIPIETNTRVRVSAGDEREEPWNKKQKTQVYISVN